MDEHKTPDYYQKLAKAAEVNHVNGLTETNHGYRIDIEKRNLIDLQKTAEMNEDNKAEMDRSKQNKERKIEYVPVGSEKVVDNKPTKDDEVKKNEIVAYKTDNAIEIKLDGLDQRKEVKELTVIELTKGTLKVRENYRNGLRVKMGEDKMSDCYPMLTKSGDANGTFMLEEAAKLWMKKVTELRRMIKRDKENELREKKVDHHSNNFERPLNDLDKTLEIKPMDISAIEKEENKINSNEKLLKRADGNNLTEKYESFKDNRKQEDICAIGVMLMDKNEVGNKGKEKDESKGIIEVHKIRDKEWKENKERKGVSNS
ncbi:hypothetical protein C2G38_2170171 [Gigaspora rosea]|uniref:Uncharacterized protein n=1 Tax=Gigaspora rosea TaxID=44941 RepID=A0A397VXU1_9GLOM|nr:hypothetical protein C2G38_2170171 [Gigaspora rosea]